MRQEWILGVFVNVKVSLVSSLARRALGALETARPDAASRASSVQAVGAAGAVRTSVGPVSELETMGAVVVANPDGFWPTQQLHTAVAASLPEKTKLLVLQPRGYSAAWHGKAPKGALTMRGSIDSQWTRDYSPIFVRNRAGQLEAVEFKYIYKGSDQVAPSLAKRLGVPIRSSKLEIEGGNILADQGRLFVTEKVLKRNPGLTKAQVEEELKRVLYVDHVEWLPRLPDEATGHVDLYAKLIRPNTMMVTDTAHPKQKQVVDAAAARFRALGYEVVRIKDGAIKPLKTATGSWGPVRSYVNSLVVNGTAYVPQYATQADATTALGAFLRRRDKAALDVYAAQGLKVVGVPAADLIINQGSVHCMTNTIPAEVNLALGWAAARR